MNEVRNVMIGVMLGPDVSEIAYFDRKTGEPCSVPTKTGTELTKFPTSLVKREGKDEWQFGVEAEYFKQTPGWITCPNPVDEAGTQRKFNLDGRLYEPWELLARFLGETVRLLGLANPLTSISGIMVTSPILTMVYINNLKRALRELGFKDGTYFIQDYKESFFYYTYAQDPAVRLRNVGLVEFKKNRVTFTSLRENSGTRPVTVTIRSGVPETLPEENDARDKAFIAFLNKSLGAELYSAIFIVGNGFNTDWSKQSVRWMSSGKRHVYYGDNLYVRGACYAVYEKLEARKLKGKLYLGENLVHTNVGMYMIAQNSSVYYPLIAAGRNWFEQDKTSEFILDDTDVLLLEVNSMDGSDQRTYSMKLDGLPARPNRTTRIRLRTRCLTAGRCEIEAEDLGFGELYPATHKKWTETILLKEAP